MFRFAFMSGKFIGKEIDSVGDDLEDMTILTEEGTPILLVDDMDSLEQLGITPDDVELVEPEDEED